MSRFTTYAIKEITSSFLFLSILLSGILWLGQGLRHIDLLTTNNVSVETYSTYILLLLPKIILLTFPICIFLSILFNLNRLRNDSELIILATSGKSEKNILIKPIILFSTSIYFIILLFSLFITPNSLKEIRYKIIEIRSAGVHVSLLKEKKFISPTSNLTIFIQKKIENDIFGLLIHDQSKNKIPQTYIAEKGKFMSINDIQVIRLFNGTIQTYNSDENRISEVAFDTYDLSLLPYGEKENTHIYSDELSTSEILGNLKDKKLSLFSKYEKEQFAELHSRIINPFYIFFYSLLPLLMIGFSKRPDESWIYPIITVSIIAFTVQIMQITLSNLLIDNNNLVSLNYIFPFMLITIVLIQLSYNFFYIFKKKNA
ncbi:LptF/LptG family permease [Pelagibacterales bacterium SAG-MED32]|nr:LptF/LptG family permease [Pelagibacterales bacterium SAG-MED32]